MELEWEVSVLPMPKYLLALDQSTDITGYALFEDEKLIKYGHLSPRGEYLERIVQLDDWLEEIIAEYGDNIEIAIEDIQLQEKGPNGGGRNYSLGVVVFKKLAHAQGTILTTMTRRKVPYQVVPSASWKSTCGIKGKQRNEQKKNAKAFVLNEYGVEVPQDEADAICIGYHVLNNRGISWTE